MRLRSVLWAVLVSIHIVPSLYAQVKPIRGPVRLDISPSSPIIPQAAGPVQFSVGNGFFTGAGLPGGGESLLNPAQWSSSVPTVATIDPSSGLATIKGLGTTSITVIHGPFRGTTVLTVKSATITSISVTPTTSIPKGTEQQFKATATYSDLTTGDVTGLVNWSSSAIGVASIVASGFSSGLATAVGTGTTTITAACGPACSGAGTVTGNTSLTVTQPALVSISLSPASATIPVGCNKQFMATGHYTDGSILDLTPTATWASSATSIATVSATGLVTGKAQGNSTITASSSAITSPPASIIVTTLLSIAVTPVNPGLLPANTQQFTAIGTFTGGGTQDITNSVVWNSSNISVATIDANTGLATAVAAGIATISATLGSIMGTSILTVELQGVLYVSDQQNGAVYSWNTAQVVSGATAPDRTLKGTNALLGAPIGMFLESGANDLYVIDTGASPLGIRVFHNANSKTGNIAPDRLIQAPIPSSFPNNMNNVAVDATRDVLYTSEATEIRVFDHASTVTGQTNGDRFIILPNGAGGEGIFVDPVRDELYVANNSPIRAEVDVYNSASTHKGSSAPNRIVSNAGLTSVAGITVDLSRDKLYVSDFTSTIWVFDNASTVTGVATPPSAKITSPALSVPCLLALDPARDELYIGSGILGKQSITVISNASTASGSIANPRTITIPASNGIPCGLALDLTRE